MITEEKIRKILYERYTVSTGVIFNYEDLEKCFKLFHKMLSANVNCKGRTVLTSRYCSRRDNGPNKTKALSECVQLL